MIKKQERIMRQIFCPHCRDWIEAHHGREQIGFFTYHVACAKLIKTERKRLGGERA